MTVVEICVDDVAGAVAAERAGADRVELCAGLAEGGLTPSIGLVRQVLARTRRVGVQVIVRPRGGDFAYSSDDVDVMAADVAALTGLDPRVGLVLGALTPAGDIDKSTLRRLTETNASVTFHRAFDAARDLPAALETLVELGVDRVLTAGGHATALDGADTLSDLVTQADGRIAIIAAGSVRPDNVGEILARTAAPEIHLRATEKIPSASTYRNPHLPYDAGTRPATSESIVRATITAARAPRR